MTSGVITGGWGFVWTVYGLSFAIYTIYTVSVVLRWRRERQKAEQDAHPSR
jgi:membrane protein implicated in regulation of membrane protease activity